MIRTGALLAILLVGIAGCHRDAADCPGGAQLQGQKPPAGFVQWCARTDGAKHGPWREWHANGNPKSSGSYVDGKMEGKWQTFSDDGALKNEGVYKAGRKDGTWTQYYGKDEGGTKNRVEEHHAGSPEVHWIAFRSDGTKWAEGTELSSQPNGAYTEYHANGKVAVKGDYSAGKKAGEWSYFDDEGRPSSAPTGTFDQR